MSKDNANAVRRSNTEFVIELMEYSANGAMAQLMVIESLRFYTQMVAKASDAEIGDGLINAASWKRTALEIKEKLEAHYGVADQLIEEKQEVQ